jgi:hypothetical protein
MFAQTKKAVSPSPAFSQIQFDPTTLRVPPHFMGHDIVRLYKAFNLLHTAEKPEYETSDQFSKRNELAETRLFLGSKTDSATLSFIVPVIAEYDADARTLVVKVTCSDPNPNGYQDHVISIRVKQYKTERSYTASNAFGAKIPVHETDIDSYHLVLDEFQFQTGPNGAIRSSIKCAPTEARRIKSTLSALAVCKIKRGEPLTDHDAILEKATFDNPHELFDQMWFLRTTLLAIWFFDSSSGKVYTKVEPVE